MRRELEYSSEERPREHDKALNSSIVSMNYSRRQKFPSSMKIIKRDDKMRNTLLYKSL